MRTRPLCAEVSLADAEPLAATASRVDTWILIEYRGLWAYDAVDGSTLSRELKSHLGEQRMRFPQSRILFVRRPERRSRDGLVAFVARTTESERELRRLELERYDDVLELDLASAGEPVDHPVLLVCTHGKHDRCCAKYGRPLYDAVREQVVVPLELEPPQLPLRFGRACHERHEPVPAAALRAADEEDPTLGKARPLLAEVALQLAGECRAVHRVVSP